MRFLRALAVIAVFIVIARYFPIFYYTSMFNDFVKQESGRNRVASRLQLALLQRAEIYSLPVKGEDIQIKEDGSLIRVSVNYKVPVDFFIFKHELSFHASGAGLAAEQ